jgi:uncharacterized membrane protein
MNADSSTTSTTNPDPAFLVECRFGFGYTLNFANRPSWVVVAILTLVPLIVLAVMALK